MLDSNKIKYLENLYKSFPKLSTENIIYKDLISVIMPLYNNEKWLKLSINSVLSQKNVNLELIIVDDGSTDGSLQIAKDFSSKYNNVFVIPLLRNFGCYYARNIGIINSHGKYISTHDSDDISEPNMLFKQIKKIKSEKKLACLCKLRRWNSDYSQPIGELKYGENTLLWDKTLIKTIGYYDSVRFSGDTEFRKRLISVFGEKSIAYLDDELYAVRTIDHSLTTSLGESNLILKSSDNYKFTFSDTRKNYLSSFNIWHKSINDKNSRVSFPLFNRKFKLGSQNQNASPCLQQKRIGTLATYPARYDFLKISLQNILPQVDKLIIYLNNYTKIPDILNCPKIQPILGIDALGDLKDNGKFYSIPDDNNSYIFTFDDDIIYPKDYVSKMINYIEMFNRTCIIGVHGTIFPDKFINYKDKKTFSFFDNALGHFVDLLGTGTTAWHNSTFKIPFNFFKTSGRCDVYFAAYALKNNIPLFSVPRCDKWLKKIIDNDQNSLYNQTKKDISSFIDLYNKTLCPYIKLNTRIKKEQYLLKFFNKNILDLAKIEILSNITNKESKSLQTRRTLINLDHLQDLNFTKILFEIIIYGKNQYEQIDETVRSLALQRINDYTLNITFADAGSTDGTLEKIANMNLINSAKLISFGNGIDIKQLLHVCTSIPTRKNTIFVCVKMGTQLSNDFLNRLFDIFNNTEKDEIVSDKIIQEEATYFATTSNNIKFVIDNIFTSYKNVKIQLEQAI